MTTEALTRPDRHIETETLNGQGLAVELGHNYLAEYDELSQALHTLGVDGKPVADIQAGNQRFAVLDLSESAGVISGVGVKDYTPFRANAKLSDKSPDTYQLEEKSPYMLVHISDTGMLTGRALRRGDTIMIGRNAAAEDPKSKRFESAYIDDDLLSRRHFSVSLDKSGGALAVQDLGSTNHTTLRYAKESSGSEWDVLSEERTTGSSENLDATQTQELLAKAEFQPIKKVLAGGREFLISHVIQEPSGRESAIMYTAIEKDGQKMVAPRMVYKSNSDGGWRVAYGYDAKDGRYVKEASEEDFAHYTQETKMAPEIVQGLDSAARLSDANGLLTQEIFRVFTTGTSAFEQTQTGAQEISYYSDQNLDPHMRAMRALSAGFMGDKHLSALHDAGYKDFTDYIERSINPALESLPGFVPEFASQQPVETRYTKHTLLGDIRVEDYAATYGSKKIIWSMAVDQKGRVWVDNIRLADARISSYGTYDTIFDGGMLTSKPLEYESQSDGLSDAEAITYDHTYNDITPVLSKMSPIRAYRQKIGLTS